MASNNKTTCLICSHDYKSSICLPSLKFNYKRQEEGDFPFGDALGSMYPILERIFHHLPYDDLQNIVKIPNKDWRDTANCSLRKRRNLCWFSLHEENDDLIFQTSPNVAFENRNFLFLMYNHKKIVQLQMSVCVHQGKKATNKRTLMEFIEENIIEWGAMNCCILGTDYLYPLFHIENANSWFSAITIPEINNVRMATTSSIPDSPKDDFYLDKEENFISLLIFTIGNPHCAVKNFLFDILHGYSCTNIALIGGVANRVITEVSCNELFGYNQSFFCIGFIGQGKCTCEAYSMVLTKEDHFESSLIKFSEGVRFQTNNFFIKLTTDQGKAKLEDALIRKFFPNVPILGMETYGQCGWNKFPQNQETNSVSIFDRFDDMFQLTYRTYATALMLLTWHN